MRRLPDITDFKKLFETQIKTLIKRRVPEQVVEFLMSEKCSVLARATEISLGMEHIPFLPVIPRTFRTPYDLMAAVRKGNKRGFTYLNPNIIYDPVTTPDRPYYIFDVEDGKATLGKSPKETARRAREQSREVLTVAEVIALCIYKDVLSSHFVWAVGSRYGDKDGVPLVHLAREGPRLCWCNLRASDYRYGTPTCASRKGFL